MLGDIAPPHRANLKKKKPGQGYLTGLSSGEMCGGAGRNRTCSEHWDGGREM